MTELPCSAGELKRRIARAYPALSDELLEGKIRICVNDQIVGDSFQIEGGRVELLSPVSGG